MKYLLAILSILVLWGNVMADPLTATQPLNSGAFNCDGVVRTVRWTNNLGPIRIVGANLWQGMQMGAKADFLATVWIEGGLGLLLVFGTGWDHYSEPTHPVDTLRWFAPHWFDLADGENLRMDYGCVNYGRMPTGGHAATTIWYTRGEP